MIGSKIIRDEIVDFYNHKDWYDFDNSDRIIYKPTAPKHRAERMKKIRTVLSEIEGNSLYTAEEADKLVVNLEKFIQEDRKKYGD